MKSYFFVLWPKLFLSNSIVKSLSQLLFFMPFVTWISSFSFTFFLFSLAISPPSKNHSIGTRSAASWTLFGNISCFPSVAMCPLFIYLICDTLLVLLLDSIQAYFLHLFCHFKITSFLCQIRPWPTFLWLFFFLNFLQITCQYAGSVVMVNVQMQEQSLYPFFTKQ